MNQHSYCISHALCEGSRAIWRFSSPGGFWTSLLLAVIYLRPLVYFGPALGISGCVGSDVAFYECRPLFLSPTPSLLGSILYFPEQRLGSRPSSMRIRAAAYNNLLARNVASILLHPVSSSARLYERTRWSDLRRLAPMMRIRTLWWTIRNFL